MAQWQPETCDAGFVGSIPERYDRYLGPMLFAEYAADLAARVRLPGDPHAELLELAAGTGILTEQLRTHLPAGIGLTVTDLNAPMLAVAERRLGPAGRPDRVTWRVADAMMLPFPDGAFDAVVCQFGVMFFPDKQRAAREAFRVLRRGGQWLFSVWGSWAENAFGRIVHEAIAGFFPDDPPGFYRVPFSFADSESLRGLALSAGFLEPEIVTLDRVAEAPSAAEAAIGLVQGNPVITAIEERGGAEPAAIVRAVAESLARTFGDRPLRFPTRARILSARRPP